MNTAGHFYVIQPWPEFAPRRIKLGWSSQPEQRLRQHRSIAPTAKLLGTWPCSSETETPARAAIGSAGKRVSREVFDFPSSVVAISRARRFFAGEALSAAADGLPNLSEIRRRKYLSQADLAEKSGVAKNTIHRLEQGDSVPQPRTIRKLADALGVDPDELTGKSAAAKAG